MSLTVHLPAPPSANALFKSLRTGRRAKTQVYAAWLEDAGYAAKMAWRALGRPSFVAPLRLSIHAGVGRQRDISNLIKPIEDLLVKAVPGLPDDRWNDHVTITRDPSLPTNTVIVTIESCAPG